MKAKKKGLSLQVEAQATKNTYLNEEDGKVVSQHGSIVFSDKGLVGSDVQFSLDQFTTVKELGRGSFGVVRLVEAPDGVKYALKEVTLTSDIEAQKNIYRELHSYIDLKHPFIVDTKNIYSAPGARIAVLQEFAALGSTESLYHRLKGGKVTENGIGVICSDILRALAFLHKQGVIHRDIKPANLLMTADGRCKLADFGVATSVLQFDSKQAEKTFTGSISYMAPERFKNTYGAASDVWSLGITLIELLQGKFPFNDFPDFFHAMQAIAEGNPPLITKEQGYTQDCVDCINAMLEKDPAKRKTCEQLLQMPFPKKYIQKEDQIRPIFARWLADNCAQ